MSIEALNSMVQKREISDYDTTNAVSSLGNTTLKEASSDNLSWLYEAVALAGGGGIDLPSSLDLGDVTLNSSGSTSGWRSGKFSFLSGIAESGAKGHQSISSRYSNLKSLSSDTSSAYTSAVAGGKEALTKQLASAKDQLAKLEAEQKALQIELDSGYDRTTGKKLKKKGKEALQTKINNYNSQITMQKTAISNLESKLSKLS